MENLSIYNQVRSVPDLAQKKISGGRLSGKTDINPMWRIKMLTEIFGMCGTGWKYEIIKKEIIAGANDEIAAFVDINLFVKNGDWSEPIPGTGGSMFVTKEKNGLYTSDECFKMALTDAISVACKALGVGADIYWQADSESKYSKIQEEQPQKKAEQKLPKETEQDRIIKGLSMINTECQKRGIDADGLTTICDNLYKKTLDKLSHAELVSLYKEVIKIGG